LKLAHYCSDSWYDAAPGVEHAGDAGGNPHQEPPPAAGPRAHGAGDGAPVEASGLPGQVSVFHRTVIVGSLQGRFSSVEDSLTDSIQTIQRFNQICLGLQQFKNDFTLQFKV